MKIITLLPFHRKKSEDGSARRLSRLSVVFVVLCCCRLLVNDNFLERFLGNPLNSATGEVFENIQTREFVGPRLELSDSGFHEKNSHPEIKTFTKFCKRWGVVTTIFDPSEAIIRAASMPSWCLVIVPDLKTPVDYMEKFNTALKTSAVNESNIDETNIFFFTVEQQKEWESSEGPLGQFVRSTPWSHFCRKNIGYLFAIVHGAEFIFDFDDDNLVKQDKDGMPMKILPDDEFLALENVDVVMLGGNAFNHHPVMNASVEESWARGFPIDLIKDHHTRGKVAYNTNVTFSPHQHSNKEIGVIQFLADDNPDIDAMHRMSKPLPMSFPLEHAASVLVPLHAYAPYNAQATIHSKNALFATLLPGTVPGRVSDIWRSYFSQCIFHDTGLQLVFSPPKITQKRNEHNLLGDLHAEQDLYTKSGRLIEFLSAWDSNDDPATDSVPKRMEKLWIDLYELEYIELEDVYALQMWLGALDQIGYVFPKLKRRFRNVAVMGQFNYADQPSIVDDVIFWTQKQKEYVTTVIAAAPFTEEHMIELDNHSVKAIKGDDDRGYYSPLKNHMRVLQKYKKHSTIKSVLYAHDDGILNYKELSRDQYPFPADELIMTRRVVDSYNISDDTTTNFFYRIFPDGHVADFHNVRAFHDIRDAFDNIPLLLWTHTIMDYCGIGQTKLAMDPRSTPYREEDGSMLFQQGSQSDFAQIPTKYADAFIEVGQLHIDHGIWIECAYPNIMRMMMKRTDATRVRNIGLCTNWRNRGTLEMIDDCDDYSAVEGRPHGFIHPLKISQLGHETFSRVTEVVQNL